MPSEKQTANRLTVYREPIMKVRLHTFAKQIRKIAFRSLPCERYAAHR